ncbi:MAG: TonB-dependent receptor, partial [Bacteroidales bacterium]|nr:TonB-dependent receptor [Bacteroidales bacterium]
MIRFSISFVFLMLIISIHAQYQISGVVSDEQNQPLPGASIVLSPGNSGATTNINGLYELNNIAPGTYALSLHYLGFIPVTKEVTITNSSAVLNFQLKAVRIQTEEVYVKAIRAGSNTPVTYSNIEKEDIDKQNLGKDIPYLIGMQPSVVTTSDAGAGIGYTGLWIRGSNIQRTNVTINGIPLNDPESHTVFWVNMPDFSSSTESIQLQRGVGTSTNGGGAFGANLNLETNSVNDEPFAEIGTSYGSFNTVKTNTRFGTGKIKNWAFEGRLSRIASDGYVDRASSNLKSFFVQGGYFTDRTTLKAVVFSGKEKTYQAWYGVDQWSIDTYGRTFNWAGAIYNDDGSYSFYENQTDNYQQDHYQLHLTQKLSPNMTLASSLHYTYGRGYYEEYNQGASLTGFPPIGAQYFGYDSTLIGSEYQYFYHDTITSGDVIVQRWLDNHFYGVTFSLNYKVSNLDFTLGGAANQYANAKHFGEIIWAQYAGNSQPGDKYYDNISDKTDANVYAKLIYTINNLHLFADMQYRYVLYKGSGFDKGGAQIDIDENYNFFNPKVGITYHLENLGKLYASVAVANREPIRTDFVDAPANITPKPERLVDYEFGLRNTQSNFQYSANAYFMNY